MRFKQFLNEQVLDEGIYDKGLFKAIFIIGLAASGKTSLSYSILHPKYFGDIKAKHVDVDKNVEYSAKKRNIPLDGEVDDDYLNMLTKGKQMTNNELFNWTNGMLPMIVNTVGDNKNSINNRIKILKSLGYDVGIVYINNKLIHSLTGNNARSRYLDPEYIKNSRSNIKDLLSWYKQLQSNKTISFFKEIRKEKNYFTNKMLQDIKTEVNKFLSSNVSNDIGKKYIEQLKDENKKLLTDVIGQESLKEIISKWNNV